MPIYRVTNQIQIDVFVEASDEEAAIEVYRDQEADLINRESCPVCEGEVTLANLHPTRSGCVDQHTSDEILDAFVLTPLNSQEAAQTVGDILGSI